MHVNGLAGGGGGQGSTNLQSGGFADDVTNAALRYRAQAPIVDELLKEIGLEGGNINKLASQLTSTSAEPKKD